jgi:hypothetical protein
MRLSARCIDMAAPFINARYASGNASNGIPRHFKQFPAQQKSPAEAGLFAICRIVTVSYFASGSAAATGSSDFAR